MSNITFTKDMENNALVVEQVINAPREKVWQAWTTPELYVKWWGPRGWEATAKHMDFRPGGYLLYGMKCVDKDQGEFYGQEVWGKSVYKAIDEPNEFTYEDYFVDAESNVNQDMPATTITVKFIDEGDGKTRIINRSVLESPEALKQLVEVGFEQGFRETLERLAEQLEQS